LEAILFGLPGSGGRSLRGRPLCVRFAETLNNVARNMDGGAGFAHRIAAGCWVVMTRCSGDDVLDGMKDGGWKYSSGAATIEFALKSMATRGGDFFSIGQRCASMGGLDVRRKPFRIHRHRERIPSPRWVTGCYN